MMIKLIISVIASCSLILQCTASGCDESNTDMLMPSGMDMNISSSGDSFLGPNSPTECTEETSLLQEPWFIIVLVAIGGAVVLVCFVCIPVAAFLVCRKRSRVFRLKHIQLQGIGERHMFSKIPSTTKLEDQLPLDPTDKDMKALDTTSFDIIVEKGQSNDSSSHGDGQDEDTANKDTLATGSTGVEEGAEPTLTNDFDKPSQAVDTKSPQKQCKEDLASNSKATCDSTDKGLLQVGGGDKDQSLEDNDGKKTVLEEDTATKATGFEKVPGSEQPSVKTENTGLASPGTGTGD